MRRFLVLVSSVLFSAIAAHASATEIIPGTGNWYLFDVDPLIAQSGNTEWVDAQSDAPLGYVGDGSALVFSFSLLKRSYLNIVDAGIAGDMFSVVINGKKFSTSSVAADSGNFAGIDADYAWSLAEFSRLRLLLEPGTYTVSGFLQQSAQDEVGLPYMATVGALQIVEADEPGAILLIGFGLLAFGLRRQYALRANNNPGVAL